MQTLSDNWVRDYHHFIVVIRDDNTYKTVDYDDERFETCSDAINFAEEQLERLRKVSPGGCWRARVILESSTRILLLK